MTIFCPKCGQVVPTVSAFCGECGTNLPEPQPSYQPSPSSPPSMLCANCGQENRSSSAFCTVCGITLSSFQHLERTVVYSPRWAPPPPALLDSPPATDETFRPPSGILAAYQSFSSETSHSPGASPSFEPPRPPGASPSFEPPQPPETSSSFVEPPQPPEASSSFVEPPQPPEASSSFVEPPQPPGASSSFVEPPQPPEASSSFETPQPPAACPKCGEKIDLSFSFCGNCGTILPKSQKVQLPRQLFQSPEPSSESSQSLPPPQSFPSSPHPDQTFCASQSGRSPQLNPPQLNSPQPNSFYLSQSPQSFPSSLSSPHAYTSSIPDPSAGTDDMATQPKSKKILKKILIGALILLIIGGGLFAAFYILTNSS